MSMIKTWYTVNGYANLEMSRWGDFREFYYHPLTGIKEYNDVPVKRQGSRYNDITLHVILEGSEERSWVPKKTLINQAEITPQKIAVLDLDTDKIIGFYNTARDAARLLNVQRMAVANQLSGKMVRSSNYNLIFRTIDTTAIDEISHTYQGGIGVFDRWPVFSREEAEESKLFYRQNNNKKRGSCRIKAVNAVTGESFVYPSLSAACIAVSSITRQGLTKSIARGNRFALAENWAFLAKPAE